MVSREQIEIILKAEDQASQVVKQNEQNFKRLGDAAKQANQKAADSTKLSQQQMNNLSHDIKGVIETTDQVGAKGASQFQRYNQGIQDSVVAFNRLDNESQEMLRYLSQMSDQGRETFLGMSSNAQNTVSKFNEMQNATTGWNNVLEITKTKMQLAGTNVDSLKGKIQVVGSSITTHLGNKWDTIKSKVTSVAGTIRGKIGDAISFVKGKLNGLGGGFDKLKAGATGAGQSLGFLKNAASMAVGMIGYDLVNSLIQGTKASLNARSSIQSFGSRLQMSGSEVTEFQNDLDELQQSFKKIDMDVVGQQAMDMAYRLGLPKTALTELTETSAIFTDAFARNGRTAEDATLAMADAMDGEFKRLKEIGISQEDLMNNGWNGDLQDKTSLLQGINGALKEQHYDELAKSVDNLDDAWQVLSITLSNLLESIILPLTPSIVGVIYGFTSAIDMIKSAWAGLPDWGKISIGVGALAVALGILAGALTGAELASVPLIGTLYSIAGAVMAISWPVVAVVAVIGLLVLAIYEVGKAFGWWNNVGDMVGAITSGIKKLWEAFINHPDVQAAIKAIGDAFNWIVQGVTWAGQEILKFFGISTGSNWDIVASIISGIGWAWNGLKAIIGTAVDGVKSAFAVLSTIVGIAVSIGQGIYNALKPIVCILLGCSPGIVPALQTVYEWFMSVWNDIADFLSGVIPNVVTTFQPIIDILAMIGEFIITQFMESWNALVSIITIVWNSVNMLILVFQSFMSGQISLSTALTMVWNIISTMFASVLSIIIQRVISFGSSLVNLAISIARNFVNNIIKFISTLPGRFASYLIDVVGRIASAGASWISTATSKAQAVVSGIMNYISQLPGKVYQEFMNIGSRMLEAGSQLVEKAKQVGQSIVDGLLGAMGIHSPGIIQEKVVGEFVDMVDRIKDRIKSAKDTAKTMGEAIVDGFGNPTLETDTSNILPNYDALKTGIGVQAELAHAAEEAPSLATTMDTTGVNEGNEEVIGSYDNLALMAGEALQSMVDRDQLAYETMKNNDALTLSAMSTNLQQKMGLMSNNVTTSMNNIVSKNQNSMNTVNNTTKSHLNSIVSKTKSANDQMIQSWEVMKNGIIRAADKIRSDSTTHFNKLSNTIGDFYGKLKNPSRWGAGSPMSGSKPSRGSRGFSKITQAIQNATLPKYLSLSQLKNNPMIQSSNFGDYVIKDNKSGMFNVADLLRYGAIKLGLGAGAYDNIPGPHVKLIKDTSKEWDMAGPLIGPYSTSKGFKVKEFLEGVPRIAWDTFRQIAEDVYSQTIYEFYYDDDHHGNWINAFNAGSMNCKHGAESIIAMANAMGLSGYMQHGHWDEYGHYFAVIEGHKMDVTGWQQRRTWTPSASAGPAPKRYGFKEFIEELKDLFKDDDPKGAGGIRTSGDKIVGEFTIIHDFRNLPNGVSAEEVAKLVEESTVNEGFLKKIAQSSIFQEYDLREKEKIERQNNRARGV